MDISFKASLRTRCSQDPGTLSDQSFSDSFCTHEFLHTQGTCSNPHSIPSLPFSLSSCSRRTQLDSNHASAEQRTENNPAYPNLPSGQVFKLKRGERKPPKISSRHYPRCVKAFAAPENHTQARSRGNILEWANLGLSGYKQ